MSDLSTLLDDLVAFSRHLRAERTLTREDLRRLEYFHQMLTYHVMYGDRRPSGVVSGAGSGSEASFARWEDSTKILTARRCSIEGCWGGPTLFNIAAGKLNGAVDWRCLAHIPPDIPFPVGLHGDEWKATGRK